MAKRTGQLGALGGESTDEASASLNPQRRPMGGYRQLGDFRFGTNEYAPDGRRLPGDRIRDGNAAALERRRQDEIARGGPMAMLHKRNEAAQSQPGAGAAMMGDTQGQQRQPQRTATDYALSGVIPTRPPNPNANVRPPMRAGSQYTSTATDPGVKSSMEAFHPSNIFKGGGMDATGHFVDGGKTMQGGESAYLCDSDEFAGSRRPLWSGLASDQAGVLWVRQ